MKRYRITVARLVTHTITTWGETPKAAMDEARLRVAEALDPAKSFPTTYGGSFVNTIVEDAPEPAAAPSTMADTNPGPLPLRLMAMREMGRCK